MIPAMIVPVLTRPELLYRMVESIDYRVSQLIVIDNGDCVDVGRASANDFVDETWVLRLPANQGVAGSWNLGIKVTPFASWWLIANFDITWPLGSLARFDRPDSAMSLVLSGGLPAWCAFSVGEDVVSAVGLFDEALHPAYFEDDDYLRRCEKAGMPITVTTIPVRHENSSTLAAGYGGRNGATFPANAAYYGRKVAEDDFSEGGWSLDTRREQSWD